MVLAVAFQSYRFSFDQMDDACVRLHLLSLTTLALSLTYAWPVSCCSLRLRYLLALLPCIAYNTPSQCILASACTHASCHFGLVCSLSLTSYNPSNVLTLATHCLLASWSPFVACYCNHSLLLSYIFRVRQLHDFPIVYVNWVAAQILLLWMMSRLLPCILRSWKLFWPLVPISTIWY